MGGMTTNGRSDFPPPWPGMAAAPEPYRAQLRSLAMLAGVAEEARQWLVDVAMDRPMEKVYSTVPPELAVKWIEACQDAYASGDQWGPIGESRRSAAMTHVYLVHGLLQSINKTIAAATNYMSMPDGDRYIQGSRAATSAARALADARALLPYNYMASPEVERVELGARAAQKAARVVAQAQNLLPSPTPRRAFDYPFALPSESPYQSDSIEVSSIASDPPSPPHLSILRGLCASLVRGVSYLVVTGVCLLTGTSILAATVSVAADLRHFFAINGIHSGNFMPELAEVIQGAPFVDLIKAMLWMILILGILAVGIRSIRHAIDALIHMVRQRIRSVLELPSVESRCLPALVSQWCGHLVVTFPLTSSHILIAVRSLLMVMGSWRRVRAPGA